ncbi:MAG: ABC transporter permease [Gammaproteobacteria bacterium]
MPEPAAVRLTLRLALRLLRRDLGGGRLLVMLLAAVIAVASTVSVNLLVNRVQRAMVAESSALLAGDLALVTKDAPSPSFAEAAGAAGLDVAHTVALRSVVAAGERLQLVRLKAVDAAYPLRGALQVTDAPFGAVERLAAGPARGEVWGDLRLFQLLGLEVGATLGVGAQDFTLSRLLVLEPDRGGDMFSFAPRLMMHADDLPATGLIVPGSRATYTTLFAGAPDAVAAFRAGLDLPAGHTLLDPRAARPEIESAFAQAERFLALAAFAGLLLATVGIALAARAYAEHHDRTVALFKTLGLDGRGVAAVLVTEITLLAVLATVLGDALAALVHGMLVARFLPASQLGGGMPLLPLLQGAWVALVVLAGFALPSLVRLTRVPVTRVLARDRSGLGAGERWPLAWMLAAVVLITPWHVGNVRLVGYTLGGMLACAAALALAALALVIVLGRVRGRTTIGWRFGLANIARRARLSVLQCTALGLGIAVLLLLGLIRNDLFDQWRNRLPPGTPNHFLINVHADEVADVAAFLEREVDGAVGFYPMVRGRLSMLNDTEVDPEAYADPRARRLADREFNLSWADVLKADNRLTAGRWWQDGATDEFSVEQGLAETLGIELGDRLAFSVAERTVSGTVTSLRAVEWDNFEVNFFVVGTPGTLSAAPATWITSFYLPPAARDVMPELVRRFPSVTVIDVDALMRQVRQVMDRVSGALSWVFGFALVAGVLVLAASVQASQRERTLDAVLLKTLGASRRFIATTMLIEFALIGALAGVLGSAGAAGTGWLLAHYVLDMPYAPDWRILAGGIAAGVIGVTLLGSIAVARTHRRSVVASLREAA